MKNAWQTWSFTHWCRSLYESHRHQKWNKYALRLLPNSEVVRVWTRFEKDLLLLPMVLWASQDLFDDTNDPVNYHHVKIKVGAGQEKWRYLKSHFKAIPIQRQSPVPHKWQMHYGVKIRRLWKLLEECEFCDMESGMITESYAWWIIPNLCWC